MAARKKLSKRGLAEAEAYVFADDASERIMFEGPAQKAHRKAMEARRKHAETRAARHRLAKERRQQWKAAQLLVPIDAVTRRLINDLTEQRQVLRHRARNAWRYTSLTKSEREFLMGLRVLFSRHHGDIATQVQIEINRLSQVDHFRFQINAIVEKKIPWQSYVGYMVNHAGAMDPAMGSILPEPETLVEQDARIRAEIRMIAAGRQVEIDAPLKKEQLARRKLDDALYKLPDGLSLPVVYILCE